ncbi:TetR/AcrR family transcriptional regulator [Streptomyces sp. BBFR2]|uniref:TetR/AcrR family transcriptional regulator n=1 Tax=Streptomyces sp. BBFR2 TaxID=3372854 RepID=UPI0037D9C83B
MPTPKTGAGAPRPAAALRRKPVQARSQRTVEKILTAATAILVESGLPALNTNAVAARAQVNVSTLYAYFPDKMAILRELSGRFDAMREEFLAAHVTGLATAPDWRPHVDGIIAGLVRLRVEAPGSAALRNALRAMPETESDIVAAVRRSADLVADALRRRNADLGREHADLISLMVSELVSRLLDLAFEKDPYDRAVVQEVISLTRRYLAPYLDAHPPVPAAA